MSNFGGYNNWNNNNGYAVSNQQPTQGYQNYNNYATCSQPYNTIPGRVVQNEGAIRPNEIPMDGNFGTFIQADLSGIYLKTWGNDGLIHTNYYKLTSPIDNQSQGPLAMIMTRLDAIENALVKSTNNKANKKTKDNQKEANVNE